MRRPFIAGNWKMNLHRAAAVALAEGVARKAEKIDAVDLADRIGLPFNRVFALAFLATGHCERGETAETLHYAKQARWLAEEQGFAFWTGISGVWEGAERVISLGEHGALEDVVRAGLVAGQSGNLGGATKVLSRIAEAALAAGDRAMTQEMIDMALAVAADTGQHWWDSALLRQQAELLFDEAVTGADDDLWDPEHPWSRAADAWLRSLDVADRLDFTVHGVRAASGYAALLQRVGRAEEGHRVLSHWYGKCTEGLDTPVLAAARTQLESLESASS